MEMADKETKGYAIIPFKEKQGDGGRKGEREKQSQSDTGPCYIYIYRPTRNSLCTLTHTHTHHTHTIHTPSLGIITGPSNVNNSCNHLYQHTNVAYNHCCANLRLLEAAEQTSPKE